MTQLSTNSIVNDGLVLFLNAGIKGSYPGSGPTWTDLAGVNDGAISGASYSTANSGIIDFSGTDQFVSMSDVLDDVFAGSSKQFTLSAWIKFDNLSVQRTIFSKLGDGSHGENNRQFVFRVYSVGGGIRPELSVYYTLISDAFRGYYASNQTIATGQWYNIVATYNGSLSESNRFNFYTNATLNTKALSFTSGSEGAIQNGTARLALGAAIGSASATNPVSELDGQIAIAMIYNRVLTATEVNQNFQVMRKRFGI